MTSDTTNNETEKAKNEQASEVTPLTGLNAADLAAFLKDNPAIFEERPELLELITLSDTRGTSSLLERQIDVLKTRLRQQQSSQSTLFKVARENEQISDSFSEIVYQMIAFTHLSEFATQFPQAIRRIFDVDEVSFKTAQGVERKPEAKLHYEDATRRLENQQSVCDNRWPNSIMQLFFSDNIKSAALISMRIQDSKTPLGILALGSTDANRYTNDLGTVHLDKLGLMSGICLSRLQLKLK